MATLVGVFECTTAGDGFSGIFFVASEIFATATLDAGLLPPPVDTVVADKTNEVEALDRGTALLTSTYSDRMN